MPDKLLLPSIADVVSRYVPLRRRGKEHVGVCPFHPEKTPSFSVNEEKGLFHCFGCGNGGDVVSFIQQIEGVDFKGALAHLGLSNDAPKLTRQQIEEKRRQHHAARAIVSWSLDMAARIAARMRDVGQRGALAGRVQKLPGADLRFLKGEIRRLQTEWEIFEALQEDLFEPAFIFELWGLREFIEGVVGVEPIYTMEEIQGAFPPFSEEYGAKLLDYVRGEFCG